MFKFDIVKTALKNNNADAFLFLSDVNRFWLTEFMSSAGIVLVTSDRIHLFLDMRYYQKACDLIKNEFVDIYVFKNKNQVIDLIKNSNIRTLLVEKEYFLFDDFLFFKDSIDNVIPFNSNILRIQKTDEEIAKMQKAVDIAVAAQQMVKATLIPGITEIELANKITSFMLFNGAEKNSFDPIVASGPNGAYPHHRPTNRVIQDNEFVTVDIGCIYDGYCSDITRTYAIGNPDQRLIDAYKKVYESNQKGILELKHKMIGKDVDMICRDVINNSEFKDYFVHGTGHGVGINVHEYPNVNQLYDKPLEHNSIVTIEPGIYIPGLGGIRIEDMVLVKKDNNHIVMTQKAEKDIF